jgi:hypothetical protein
MEIKPGLSALVTGGASGIGKKNSFSTIHFLFVIHEICCWVIFVFSKLDYFSLDLRMKLVCVCFFFTQIWMMS